jgi:hypothetical protein
LLRKSKTKKSKLTRAVERNLGNKNRECDILRKADIFGTPITFNYNGDSHYTTACGGILSVSIVASLFFLALVLFHRYFTGFNPVIAEFSARFDRND